MLRSRIVFLVSLAVFCMFVIPVSATTGGPDGFGYTFIDSNSPGGPAYSWIEISGTGTQILPNVDDASAVNIPLGFVFNYYGTNYNQLSISTNGLILSTGSGPFTNEPIGSSTIHGFIAPYWDDLVTSDSRSADAIYYTTDGAQPNRRFIVEWKDNYHFSTGTSGITFEAIIYEETNNIKFQYLDVDFGLPAINNGASATVGIESQTGTDGLQYSYNQPVIVDELAILFKYPVRSTSVPEFPSIFLPAIMIIGFIGAMLLILRTKEY